MSMTDTRPHYTPQQAWNADMKRQLEQAERERDEARAQLSDINSTLDRFSVPDEAEDTVPHRAQMSIWALEHAVEALSQAERERDEANAQIERLREALAWYADSANHMDDVERDNEGTVTGYVPEAVRVDAGDRARAALALTPATALAAHDAALWRDVVVRLREWAAGADHPDAERAYLTAAEWFEWCADEAEHPEKVTHE